MISPKLRNSSFNNSAVIISSQFSTVSPASSSSASNESTGKKRNDDDDDFLSNHGGKVVIVALSIAAALIYKYYLGIQDRNAVEKMIEEHETSLNPYEMLELRFANQISESQMNHLVMKVVEQLAWDSQSLDSLSLSNTTASGVPPADARQIHNIPFLSYDRLIELTKAEGNDFRSSLFDISYNPSMKNEYRNQLYMTHYLDRVIRTQIEQDFVSDVIRNRLLLDIPELWVDYKRQKKIEEEIVTPRAKGKLEIAEKNKGLFTLYPKSYEQLMGNQDKTDSHAAHFDKIPMAADYLLVVLTLLMQTPNYPENIQQRLRSLFLIANVIQFYHQKESNVADATLNLQSFKDFAHNSSTLKISRGKRVSAVSFRLTFFVMFFRYCITSSVSSSDNRSNSYGKANCRNWEKMAD
jgi:hypothetical protein